MGMFEYWFDVDLYTYQKVKDFGIAYTQDANAHKIGARVTKHGEPVTLAGTVRAWIIIPNKTTFTVDGSMEGNMAWVILPEEAYREEGKLGIYLKVINGSEVTTLFGAEGRVYKSR